MEDKNQLFNPFSLSLQSNDCISDSFQGRDEIVFENKTVAIGLQIDSKDIVYGFKYISQTEDNNLSMIFSLIEHIILDQKTNDIKKLDRDMIIASIEKNDATEVWIQNNSLNFELCLSLLRSAIKEFDGFSGGYCEQKGMLPQDIICRCIGLGFKDIQAAYLRQNGNIKDTKIETKVSSLCGSCSEQVSDVFSDLEDLNNYYDSVPNPTWVYRIKEALKKYLKTAEGEYSPLKFEVIQYKMNTVKIRCTRPASTPKRKDIEDTMSKYLQVEIDKDLAVKIVT